VIFVNKMPINARNVGPRDDECKAFVLMSLRLQVETTR
jgi:hypothetical protein